MPLNLTESDADAAAFSAMREGTLTAEPEPAPQPEPEPEAAPAAPAAKAAEPEPAKPAEPPAKKPEFVPHAALHEERVKRQALERELAELRAKAGQPQPKTEIDPEADPLGALRELREFKKSVEQQTLQQQEMQQFTQRVMAHEADFAAATPDYAKAVEHLRSARAAELRALGVPEPQIQMQLHGEALQTAQFAFQNGKNPGEVFYALAKTRGYNPDAVKEPEPAPVPAPEAAPAPAAAVEKLERIARGQKAGRPTAGAGGGAPAGELSLEDGVKLEGAAFDKWFEANARRLMN